MARHKHRLRLRNRDRNMARLRLGLVDSRSDYDFDGGDWNRYAGYDGDRDESVQFAGFVGLVGGQVYCAVAVAVADAEFQVGLWFEMAWA
jgi:hypothetical protein